ncbi:PILR alpha-associated neural protein isoform X2 [Nerophis ophidion]|uniref:PILR alpha-associated neural protein isoform X2 n=1 Tax=Nerophis ophidion TaxID=159077 RepID=UPI002ADFBAF8|nr:PILR alpha-associated neural protein isoform X2 [Nerophis ophidion]
MERRSVSPVARLTALVLVALATQPSTCNRDDGEERVDALSVQLSVTTQVTPTPLWAVVWGPTQPLEDDTYHFLSSQETEHLRQQGDQREAGTPVAASEDWPRPDASTRPQDGSWSQEDGRTQAEGTELEEEVDPQFYVTVTISSLLILTAIIITAKLCVRIPVVNL